MKGVLGIVGVVGGEDGGLEVRDDGEVGWVGGGYWGKGVVGGVGIGGILVVGIFWE